MQYLSSFVRLQVIFILVVAPSAAWLSALPFHVLSDYRIRTGLMRSSNTDDDLTSKVVSAFEVATDEMNHLDEEVLKALREIDQSVEKLAAARKTFVQELSVEPAKPATKGSTFFEQNASNTSPAAVAAAPGPTPVVSSVPTPVAAAAQAAAAAAAAAPNPAAPPVVERQHPNEQGPQKKMEEEGGAVTKNDDTKQLKKRVLTFFNIPDQTRYPASTKFL